MAFLRRPVAKIFGITAKIAPPEELIWQKAYVVERERFGGVDVAHPWQAALRE